MQRSMKLSDDSRRNILKFNTLFSQVWKTEDTLKHLAILQEIYSSVFIQEQHEYECKNCGKIFSKRQQKGPHGKVCKKPNENQSRNSNERAERRSNENRNSTEIDSADIFIERIAQEQSTTRIQSVSSWDQVINSFDFLQSYENLAEQREGQNQEIFEQEN